MCQDIYFELNYAKLYEAVEHGQAVKWCYRGDEGVVTYLFLIRQIPVDIGETLFDIVTPYGYGGPVIEQLNDGFSKAQLVDAFDKAFSQYCADHKIVSEFVRFHPMLNNGEDFKSIYQSECIRHTLGTNLRDYEDPFMMEFSRSCRKVIKKCISNGLTWKITAAPDNLDTFIEIYYATMDRNHAADYYYFGKEYFEDCIRNFREHLVLVEAVYQNKTIAAGMYFTYGKTIHVHLSGTLAEYLSLSPAYILKYATLLWGKENGFDLIHYGGGTSNSPDDPLYMFKKKFSQNTEFPFYIGRKIRNQQYYDALCEKVGKKSDFFPQYRDIN